MRILLLGPVRPALESYLASFGDQVERTDHPLPPVSETRARYDLLVSYGYRHRILKDWLLAMPNRIVNLHISYLPWNRGADPNLWSFLEGTPKGVSIHLVDEGLDTGPILAQREVAPEREDTLATSYARLISELETLFRECWPSIRANNMGSLQQPPGGSVHRARDRERVVHLLTRGWDTPVAELVTNYRRLMETRNA